MTYQLQKRIFTFWEPQSQMPDYLELCMQTWKKYLPEYEIIVLDYTNLDFWLGQKWYDSILYRCFSLPMQADAVRCAVLKRHGGIWMDCDTIITSDKIRDVLSISSPFIMVGNHIAFIKANKDSKILTLWENDIKKHLNFYKIYKDNRIMKKIYLWFKNPRKYRKLSKNVDGWDYLGNMILGKIFKKFKNSDDLYMIKTNYYTKIFPELNKYSHLSADTYQKFYFENNYATESLENDAGIILLHNSWTPSKYRNMSQKDFLEQNNTLAQILKRVLQ